MGAAVISLALTPPDPTTVWLLCGCENGAVYVYPADEGDRTHPYRVFRSDTFHLSTIDVLEPLSSRLVGASRDRRRANNP